MSAQDYLKLLDFLIPLVDKYGTAEVKSQVAKILASMGENP
jgi:hypothetical protein